MMYFNVEKNQKERIPIAKPVFISTDSTCDMPAAIVEQLGFGITPLGVTLGDEQRTDGVDITPDEIYDFYDRTGILAKTNAVPPQQYTEFFKKQTDAGFAVVHISLSSGISASHQNANIAAADFPDVFVVDSKNVSGGTGPFLFEACAMRDAGAGAQEIAQRMLAMRDRVDTSLILHKLLFLSKGGRCSAVTAFGANILGIKPSIEMMNGSLEVCKKYRGGMETAYSKYVRERLAGPEAIDRRRIFLTHSGLPEAFLQKMKALVLECVPFEEVIFIRTGCVISSHAGPEALALMFLKAE